MLQSPWAYVLGVPVSLPALIAYLMVLASTRAIARTTRPLVRQRAWWVLRALGVSIVAAALWFIVVQLWVIKAICPFCMAAHACGLIVGGLILRRVPGRPTAIEGVHRHRAREGPKVAAEQREPDLVEPRRGLVLWCQQPTLVGLAAAVFMIGAQMLHHPPTYKILRIDSDTVRLTLTELGAGRAAEPEWGHGSRDGGRSSAKETLVTSGKEERSRRALRLYGGLFEFDLNEVPLLGRRDAPCVMLCLFDYTCQHCRQLHPLLVDAVRRQSNRLAVVSLPVPLDTNCNRVMTRSLPEHVGACDYARAGLAVWRADPAQGEGFDDWFFAQPRRPTIEAVQAEAQRRVGTNAFAECLADPWISRQLDLSIRLYHTNYLRYHRGALPQVLLGTNLVLGLLRTDEQIQRLLSAGCPPGPPASSP